MEIEKSTEGGELPWGWNTGRPFVPWLPNLHHSSSACVSMASPYINGATIYTFD
jgi:hypothetical protein